MAPTILIIQLRQLGDILLTTPCIREIKRAWPEATVDFLAHPMGRLVLEGNPYLHELIVYDPKGGWREEWKLIQKLRRKRYDIVLDFMYNPRSTLYARLSGAPRRLAFRSRRAAFFTEIVPQSKEVEYIVTEKFRYLQQLGIKGQSLGLDLPWFHRDASKALGWLERNPVFAAAPLRVVMSATHRRPERQWPISRFAWLADQLIRTWKAQIVWIWGPGEEDFVKAAQSLCIESTYLSPATSFRELAALIAQCDLFIGNSNGPSHVAVAVDTPSLQLHGPTYAATWCPHTERHRSLQAGALENIPPAKGSMDLLGEEEVWQALEIMRPLLENAAAERREGRTKAELGWTCKL